MILQLIAALKRMLDEDGHLELDRHQALALLFVLYAVDEGDGASVKFAIKDLLGLVPDGREERGA